jgi:hypothetical protein
MTHGSMRMQARPLAATSQPTAPPAQVPQQPSPQIQFLDWLRVLALVGSSCTTRCIPSTPWSGRSRTPTRPSSSAWSWCSSPPGGWGCSSCWPGREPACRCDHARAAAMPPNGSAGCWSPAGRLGPAGAAGLHRGTPPRLVGRLLPLLHPAVLRRGHPVGDVVAGPAPPHGPVLVGPPVVLGHALAVLERWADPHALVAAGHARLQSALATASAGQHGAGRATQWPPPRWSCTATPYDCLR